MPKSDGVSYQTKEYKGTYTKTGARHANAVSVLLRDITTGPTS